MPQSVLRHYEVASSARHLKQGGGKEAHGMYTQTSCSLRHSKPELISSEQCIFLNVFIM